MMTLFRKMKSWSIFHLLLGVSFIVAGLCVNVVLAVLYITLRPFSLQLYRRLAASLVYSFWSQLVFLAQWWSGSYLRMFVKEEHKSYFGKEHAVIIMNHSYEVDWLMGWLVADQFRVLGTAKVFVKKVIKYFPLIGWAWVFVETVFLERNWEKDKVVIEKSLKSLPSFPIPVWLLIFAEGTRFTKEKHADSMAVAKAKGLPPLKRHLLPRTKGFVFTVKNFRGTVPAIYNVVCAINHKEGAEPTLWNMLKGKQIVCDMFCERIPLEDVPDGDDASAMWLHELYQRKDKMMNSYYETGSFGCDIKDGWIMPRRLAPLFHSAFWMVVGIYVLFSIIRFFLLGSASAIVIGTLVIGILSLGIYKMIGLTKISKASSYGKKQL